jgi:hypothetical protein
MAEKKFGDLELKVAPLLATKAMVLQARLLRLIAPGVSRLGEIMQGVGEDVAPEAKSQAAMVAVGALADIFAQGDPDEVAGMIKELVCLAEVRRADGNYFPIDFDGDFTTRKGQILPVVVWVLQEQFGDFFSGLPGIGNQKILARA